MLFESILCAVLYVFFKCFDYQLGTLYAFRPIVVCPVVGAFLGDLHTGLILGASIEALFMGSVSIGAYIPPDATSAGLLCTAYVCLLGLDTEVAVGLAMPIGTLVLGVGNLAPAGEQLAYEASSPASLARARAASSWRLHWLIGVWLIPVWLVLIFCAVYFGSGAIDWLVNAVPEFVLNGFAAAANILPVMGFAMLLRLIYRKELLPYLFLGFLLTSYMGVSTLGVALLAAIIAILTLGFFDKNQQTAAQIEGADDDAF